MNVASLLGCLVVESGPNARVSNLEYAPKKNRYYVLACDSYRMPVVLPRYGATTMIISMELSLLRMNGELGDSERDPAVQEGQLHTCSATR